MVSLGGEGNEETVMAIVLKLTIQLKKQIWTGDLILLTYLGCRYIKERLCTYSFAQIMQPVRFESHWNFLGFQCFHLIPWTGDIEMSNIRKMFHQT